MRTRAPTGATEAPETAGLGPHASTGLDVDRVADVGAQAVTAVQAQGPAALEVAHAHGLRERKKQATRGELSRAALRLAMERGLDNVLVEDIAAAADVSPRTFNNYFTTKYEAICALGAERASQIGDTLRRRPAGEGLWQALTAAVVAHYETGQFCDPAAMASLKMMLTSPQLRGEHQRIVTTMREALAAAIAERMAAAGVDSAGVDLGLRAEVLAAAVTATAQVAVRRWFAATPATALRPLLEDALAHLQAALRAPETTVPPTTDGSAT